MLGRRQAGEADYGRPAAREGEEAGADPIVDTSKHLLDFVLAHRQEALSDLEHLTVENGPGRYPGRPITRGDQDLHRRLLHDPLDERLRGRRFLEEVVVVDDDPGVLGPARHVL